ncbi:biotin-protein ligase [Pseudanabaena sp. lw0831]|uniref:biotin--[acetyl-CoA-carboxylase] ligase n=1 Tax=Pseudanabaena sp. lw0831 TaxID=1357935 RepID=UPI001916A805|nr:biotin--[acetyl-CoA-carboxylase] ligase [Pseudanabaena sp. lw0831]GBO52461.1 biotin-protein ligase [Pseudanabaena sp. lw0831]
MNCQIIRYEEIDSTNSEAWRLIDSIRLEALSNTAIIAKRQTKGRGQRGNGWQSDLGGLFMSVILQPNLTAANAHQITLWSAWGIAKALNETGANVKLKWLNDLLIDRRKLGGILTETRIEAGKIRYAVVGIGINWTNDVPEGAIALGELPTTLSNIDELIEVVLKGIQLGQTRSDREGMVGILAEYLELLSDKKVHQTINGRELQGQIIDIRPTGELVVRWEGNSQEAIYQPQNFSVGYQ